MKNFIISLSICLCWSANAQQNYNIHDLIKSKTVTATATSTGEYSGVCIRLNIVNPLNKAMNIEVPAGSIFLPEDEEEQTIFVIEDQDFIVEKKGNQTYNVKGYCSEASDRSPTADGNMQIDFTTNKKLLALAEYAGDKRFSNSVNSSAVWAVSDNKSVSNVYDGNKSVKIDSLQSAICRITGQEKPWYNTRQEIHLDEERNIVASPVSLQGTLTAEIDKPGIVKYAIYNAAGEQQSSRALSMNLPRKGQYDLNFSLKVRGWESGTYTVKIIFDGESIHERNFEV